MANTRQSTKRARHAKKRQERNVLVRSKTRTSIKKAVEAIQDKNLAPAKELLKEAIRSLSKAASKGVVPKKRAARKISRLAALAKKVLPESARS